MRASRVKGALVRVVLRGVRASIVNGACVRVVLTGLKGACVRVVLKRRALVDVSHCDNMTMCLVESLST